MSARRLLAWLGALAAALVLVLLSAAPTWAHATLVGSNPADGSRLAEAPATVELTFDEPVQLVRGSAHVLNGSLQIVNQPQQAGASGAKVEIPLPASLPTGAYVVVWQVISADGHNIAGSLRFGVRTDADAAAVTPKEPTTSAADRAHDILGGFGNAAAVLVIGLPLAHLLVTRRRPGARVLPLVLIGGVIDIFVSAGLIFVDAARATGADVVSTAPFTAAQLGNHGQQMLWLRILGVLVLMGGLLFTKRLFAIAVPLAALVLGHAWIGHAAVGSWQALAVLAAALHLTAVCVWMGGLLLLITRQLPVSGDPALTARWSRVATWCVATIAVTGIVQAVRQVSPLASLWSTTYGALVLVKAGLLLVIVGMAFTLRKRLRRGVLVLPLVGLEIFTLVWVLTVTGVLQAHVPARDDYGPPLVAHAPLGADDLRVSLTSTRPGPVTIRVSRRHDGVGAALQQLSGSLVGSVQGPVSLPLRFTRASDGSWTALGNLPAAGRWRLQFNAQLDADLAYATTVSFKVW